LKFLLQTFEDFSSPLLKSWAWSDVLVLLIEILYYATIKTYSFHCQFFTVLSQVIKLFDQMDQSDCVLRIVEQAIKEAELEDPELATLHSIKFHHLLRIGRHSEAFEAMHYNPDTSRRQDSLRQLINSLVHHHQLQELVTFNYSQSMLAAAEDVLLTKARSQDLLSADFYTVLHALHVKNKNYRKGTT